MASSDEDYNQPSQERLKILQRLQDALGGVPPHFWAACHVCDLSELEKLEAIAKINRYTVYTVARQTQAMIANWNQSRRGSGSGTSTPQSLPMSGAATEVASSGLILSPVGRQLQDTNTPPAKRRKFVGLSRSKVIRDNAAKRDNNRCVITSVGMIQVAYICPFCLLSEEDDKFGSQQTFWNMLRIFWSEQKVTSWRRELFLDDFCEAGAETAANMITLNPLAYALWNKGAFALKPISLSDDKTTLTIQFFWQATHVQIQFKMNLLTIPPSTRGLDGFGYSHLNDYRIPKDNLIKSGDLFILKTDDPKTRPLPSIALLEMQWCLQRIMGMAGAVEIEEDEEREDSDNAISDLGLAEAGDASFISNDVYPQDPAVPDLRNT